MRKLTTITLNSVIQGNRGDLEKPHNNSKPLRITAAYALYIKFIELLRVLAEDQAHLVVGKP